MVSQEALIALMGKQEALITSMGKQEAIDDAMKIVKNWQKVWQIAYNLPNMLSSFLLYCMYVRN